MKKKTKLLSLFSATVIPLTGMTAFITSCKPSVDESIGRLKYETLDNGIKVTGLENAGTKVKSITVPNEINGKPVIEITEGAFTGCANLDKITLPFIGRTSDSTGAEALFGYVFGSTTYEGCGSTTWQEYDVTNKNEVSTEYASYCIPMSLEHVAITNCKQIPAGAFSKCLYLEDITINKHSSTEIQNKAFYGCYALNGFDFSCVEGVKTIAHSAFQDCGTFQYIVIPSTVTTIGENAFKDCESCATMKIGSNVTKVEAGACSGVTGVILVSDSESTIGANWEDDWCDSNSIVVYDYTSSGSRMQTNDWYALVCGSGDNKYAYLIQWMGAWSQTEITIPSTITADGVTLPVKIIGGRTFQENPFIKHVIIEKGVEHIFAETFKDCTALEYVDFPESLLTIRTGAFEGCSKLVGHHKDGQEVDTIILENVTEIGDYAFKNCSSILEVTFNNVKTIGKEAFAYCTHLCPDTTVQTDNCLLIPATCTSIGEGAFKYCFKYAPNSVTASIYYPTVKFANNNLITQIPDNCFEWCGVRTLKPTSGWDAGVQYPKQLRVNIDLNGAKLVRIGDYAFNNCWISKLGGARNTHLKYIGDYAFYYAQMTSETSATETSKGDLQMDQEIEYIGDYAFANCTTVQSLTFNTAIDDDDGTTEMHYNSLKHLGDRAFYNCNNQDFNTLDLSPCVCLRSSDFDEEPPWFKEHVDSYPDYTPRYAFAYCSNLKTVYLPGNNHGRDIRLPQGQTQVMLDRLPERFFEGCTNLGASGDPLVIPSNIVELRYAACNGCTYLQKVYIQGEIEYMGSSIFNNNYKLEKVVKNANDEPVVFSASKFNNSTVGSYIYNNCYKLVKAPVPIYTPTDETTAKSFSLREQMYYQNKALTEFTLPYNCYNIGARAFMYCEKLEQVHFTKRTTGSSLYNDLDTLNAYAFSNCKALTTIELENTKLKYVYGSVFENCSKLSSIKLPTQIKAIQLKNKPFEGWKLDSGDPIVYFAIINHTLQSSGAEWPANRWKYDDTSTWPGAFTWRGNNSGEGKLTFTRVTGQNYYICDNNACGGTDDNPIHFIPYAN